MKQVFLYVFPVFVFAFGLYIAIGAFSNWPGFQRMYKRFDLVSIFGDLGRVTYIMIGLLTSLAGIFLFLKIIGFGPLAGMK
jgi:hypothetical protein